VIAQLSDPHLRPEDPDAEPALAAAVATVLGLRAQPDAVLLSGDLTHDGDAASYARVAELLAPLPMPVVAIPGNHDDREAMRAAGFATTDDGPLHHDVDAGPLRLLALDDHVPGAPYGELTDAGIDWLRDRLGERPDQPTLIALHHPAWHIGLPALDEIALLDDDAGKLAGIVATSPQVVGLTAGHVHRAAFTRFAGRPAATTASVHTQAKLEIGAPDYDMVLEPPSLLVHALLGGQYVVHLQPVL
jgi:3',5'-cyclic-AMP phosphodiesterase